MNRLSILKLNLIVLIVVALLVGLMPIKTVEAAVLTPNATQFLEMRAKEINDVSGEKQLIFELWAHDLDFNGFDVRFKYDDTKFEPSNINTNATVDIDNDVDITYFKFETEFETTMDMFAYTDLDTSNYIRMVFSINTPTSDTQHIIGEKFVATGQDVLIGKMSFKMKVDTFDITGFSLVQDSDHSPTTGIKINLDPTGTDPYDSYENQSVFVFTDKTASKDATLKDLKISREVEDTTNPGTLIDKDYPLTPTFDPTTNSYTLEILEYIDTMDLLAEQNDANAKMKLKYPKRNIVLDPTTNEVITDELVYGTPGDVSTLQYDEADLADNTKTNFVLNKLGEPDTTLTVEVTAEDGTTTESYTITIHRPCGTVKGQIILGGTGPQNLKDSIFASYGITIKHIADISFYKAGDFNWDGIIDGTYSSDFTMLANYPILRSGKSDDNGDFEIYIIPGSYDCLIERLGFLQDVTKTINIADGDIINLGQKEILEGDTDRTGMIDLGDLTDIVSYSGSSVGDGIYQEQYDFGQKGYVGLDDLVSVVGYMYKIMTISTY